MRVEFTLVGKHPILFHADDVEAADLLQEWRRDSDNKNLSVPGDDRSPPWTWQTYLYHDGEQLTWPMANIQAGLRHAGKQMILKKQKTFKEATQSGIIIENEHNEFLGPDGNPVAMEPILAIRDLPFKQQADAVRDLGFKLFVKRARVGQAKHVRVRARFETWRIRGTLEVTDTAVVTFEKLEELFYLLGKAGQGDWRPSSPQSPGPYGMAEARLKKLAA